GPRPARAGRGGRVQRDSAEPRLSGRPRAPLRAREALPYGQDRGRRRYDRDGQAAGRHQHLSGTAYDIQMLDAAPATRATAADDDSPAVVFENVSFAFDDLVLLRDISFTVPRGSMRFL